MYGTACGFCQILGQHRTPATCSQKRPTPHHWMHLLLPQILKSGNSVCSRMVKCMGSCFIQLWFDSNCLLILKPKKTFMSLRCLKWLASSQFLEESGIVGHVVVRIRLLFLYVLATGRHAFMTSSTLDPSKHKAILERWSKKLFLLILDSLDCSVS